jgi:hypothetical protein
MPGCGLGVEQARDVEAEQGARRYQDQEDDDS